MKPSLLHASVLLGALAGCAGPDYGMSGTVKTGSHCQASDGLPQPVAGARVSFTCPNRPDLMVATTDARGRFAAVATAEAMSTDPACQLVVEKPGYLTRRYPLLEVCWDARGGSAPVPSGTPVNPSSCRLLGATALLVPDASAKGGAP